MGYFLGIDLGTSSVKAAIFNENGVCCASGISDLSLSKLNCFEAGRDMHNPEMWWNETVSAVRQALAGLGQLSKLEGIACCGFHHVPVFLDESGKPAMPVIMMHDQQLPFFRQKLYEDSRLELFHKSTHSLVSSSHLPCIAEQYKCVLTTPVIAGGGSGNHSLVQIIADVLGQQVICVRERWVGCLGAAMLAGIGTGAFRNCQDAAAEMVPKGQKILPSEQKADLFRQHYTCFKALVERIVLERNGESH